MKYHYSGPASGVSLREGDAVRDVMLHPGTEVELPAELDYTKTLVALGHLTAVTPPAASPTKTKGSATHA